MVDNFKSITSKLENSVSSLQTLRKKTIKHFNIILIFSFIPVIFIEFKEGNNEAVITLITTIVFLTISTILMRYQKNQLALCITTITIPLIGFYFCFSPEAPIVAVFGQICMFLGIFLLVLSNKSIKYTYWVFFIIGLSCVYYFVVSNSDFIGPILITSCLSYLFLHYSNFLDSQNELLSEAIIEQRNTNKEILVLNKKLFDKNDEMQTFNNILSHDLKAPLRTIISFSGLLKKKLNFQDEKEEQFFLFIKESADQMQLMIDELLLFHKVGNEKIAFEKLDVREVVNEVITFMSHDIKEKNAKINFMDLPAIKGNKTFMVALFRNLLSNGLKFQPKNKQNHFPVIELWHETDIQKQQVHIFISDNGVGIDPTYQDKLFEPFKRFHNQSEYKGTGLGMSICKSIMEKHKGHIVLENTSAEGTTFKLSFSQNN